MCLKIAMDEKAEYRDRMEGAGTAAEASANIFKFINEGPTFKTSVDVKKLPFDNNHQDSINDNNNRVNG